MVLLDHSAKPERSEGVWLATLMRNRFLTIVVAACTVVYGSPAPAHAGMFDVHACRDASPGANNAWAFSVHDVTTMGGTDACSADDGLQVYELMGSGPAAAAGHEAWWTFTAPTGTRVRLARLTRYLHTYGDSSWNAEVRADGTVLENCHQTGGLEDCYLGTRGTGRTDTFTGLDASSLRFGGYCVPKEGFAVCGRGATLHRLETWLYGATVTLSDDEPPTVSLAPTGLASGTGYITGPGAVTTTASDNTGVRRRDFRLDGMTVASVHAPTAAQGGCRTSEGVAFTYAQPCAGARGVNGERTDTLDPASWPQGARDLQVVAVDTGTAETSSAPRAVVVDTQPPPAPKVELDAPSTNGALVASVTTGDATGGSPVRGLTVLACRAGDCRTQQYAVDGSSFERAAFPDLPEGTWDIQARQKDAAGHTGVLSPPQSVIVDRTPPTIDAVRPSGGTYPTGASVRPDVTAGDNASGVAAISYALSVDGGPFQPHAGALVVHAGHTYRFRAIVSDRAANTAVRDGEPFRGPDTSFGAPVAPVLPGTTTPGPSTSKTPAPCRLRITSTQRLRSSRLLVRGTVRAGRRVTATLAHGGRTTKAQDRTTGGGRFAIAVRSPRKGARTATLRVGASGCATVTRRAVKLGR